MKYFRYLRQFILPLAIVVAIGIPGLVTAQDTLDPFDDNIQEFLAFMEIELEPTETIWQDQDFVTFVQTYENIQNKSEQLITLIGDIALGTLDLAELGTKIDDPRFQEYFNLTGEDFSELDEIRNSIVEGLEEMKSENTNFLDSLLLLSLFDTFIDEDDFDEFDDGIWVDAWAEPWEAIEAGRIIWLHADVYDSMSDDLLVEWVQTFGPDVTWLNTDSLTDVAFIVPEYDILGDITFLEFEVMVDDGLESTYEIVWVNLVMG